jgi:hypothetical protein
MTKWLGQFSSVVVRPAGWFAALYQRHQSSDSLNPARKGERRAISLLDVFLEILIDIQ